VKLRSAVTLDDASVRNLALSPLVSGRPHGDVYSMSRLKEFEILAYHGLLAGLRFEEDLPYLARRTARFGALPRPRHSLVHISAFQY
jgi:hypothetical protein